MIYHSDLMESFIYIVFFYSDFMGLYCDLMGSDLDKWRISPLEIDDFPVDSTTSTGWSIAMFDYGEGKLDYNCYNSNDFGFGRYIYIYIHIYLSIYLSIYLYIYIYT